jgi:hypothetical protein
MHTNTRARARDCIRVQAYRWASLLTQHESRKKKCSSVRLSTKCITLYTHSISTNIYSKYNSLAAFSKEQMILRYDIQNRPEAYREDTHAYHVLEGKKLRMFFFFFFFFVPCIVIIFLFINPYLLHFPQNRHYSTIVILI